MFSRHDFPPEFENQNLFEFILILNLRRQN